MIRSTSSMAETPNVSSLPMLSAPPYPRMANPLSPDLVNEWNNWASSPMVGSYKFSTSDSIHFPFMDIQTVYRDTVPDFSASVRGTLFPPALKLKNTHSPNADGFLLTRKGNKFGMDGKPSANQDRSVILSFPNQDWWIGLFDGHGEFGHVASQYASLEFPKRLHQILSMNDDKVKESLREIFLGIHRSMPNLTGAGSTAISIWKRKNLLYISNLGDSQAFVASFDRSDANNVRIIYQTKPHKPNDPEETQRIIAKGGQVEPPPFPGATARVLIPLSNGIDVLGLAMSRSLGDHEGEAYGVIAEPTTDIINLSDLDPKLEYAVVVASDGLFDKVLLSEIAQHVATSLQPNSSLLPLAAAEELILKSSHGWLVEPFMNGYRDDISIAAHRLRIQN